MFLSRLISRRIINKSGERVGRIADVVVTNLNSPLPAVTGFVVSRRSGKKKYFIPITDVETFESQMMCLTTDTINYSPFVRREEEVLLQEHILDKQIIDVKERKLTRINDLELTQLNNTLFLSGVDVSLRGILNRLGFPTWGIFFKYNSIPWQDIQFLGVDLPVKVKIDYDRLEKLHPADIARFLFQGPQIQRGAHIIQSLEGDIAADVVESLPIDLQVNIIENMSTASAAGILSQMESHHAADLIAELETTKANELLLAMHQDTARVINELQTYPAGTAGSMMKIEYITAPQNMTVEELLQKLHSSPKLPEFLLYFYITENALLKKLVGVVTIWDIFKAEPRVRLESIMERNVVAVEPNEKARAALKKMTQYDISAIPVVNKKNHILGIVTLTHAIKLVIPKSWQTRVIIGD